MTEQSLELCAETDSEGGTRTAWLRNKEDGDLILEGQDLGGSVGQFFGSGFREYEWAWSLQRERQHLLLGPLGLRLDSPQFLEQVAASLRGRESRELQRLFEEAGATFWSRVGE